MLNGQFNNNINNRRGVKTENNKKYGDISTPTETTQNNQVRPL
jgi:hypothetical protein